MANPFIIDKPSITPINRNGQLFAMTVPAVAYYLHCAPATVRQLIRDGKLEARGKRKLTIPVSSVEAFTGNPVNLRDFFDASFHRYRDQPPAGADTGAPATTTKSTAPEVHLDTPKKRQTRRTNGPNTRSR